MRRLENTTTRWRNDRLGYSNREQRGCNGQGELVSHPKDDKGGYMASTMTTSRRTEEEEGGLMAPCVQAYEEDDLKM